MPPSVRMAWNVARIDDFIFIAKKKSNYLLKI